VPPVAAKRIGGVVAAAERARHQARRVDRPRSGRPPRGDWYAVAPLAVGAVLRGNPMRGQDVGIPRACPCARGRRPCSCSGSAPASGRSRRWRWPCYSSPSALEWHRNFTVDGMPASESSTAGSSNPVRPPSRDAPPQSSPSPLNAGVSARAAAAPAMDELRARRPWPRGLSQPKTKAEVSERRFGLPPGRPEGSLRCGREGLARAQMWNCQAA
jgi:hypothetical protein